jgi:prepilin-type processing-associated H-X9-DG protein
MPNLLHKDFPATLAGASGQHPTAAHSAFLDGSVEFWMASIQ